MEYETFESILNSAGLSKKCFAALMGLNATSVTNYAAGNVPRHLAIIAAFCSEYRRMGMDFESLISTIPHTKKRRGRDKTTNKGSSA